MFAVVLLIKSTIQILNIIKWKFSKFQLVLDFKGWPNARFCIYKIFNQNTPQQLSKIKIQKLDVLKSSLLFPAT